ncbi:vacuolar membrane protein [Ceratobasidium sp. AG-Ba]|nr:vacuolar membrane protein [Ceratobasidium sp. AG-Ba]
MTTDHDSWHFVLWVRMFAGEALVNVFCTSRHGLHFSVSPIASSIALKWLVDHCPRLRHLTLFPTDPTADEHPDGENILLHFLYEKPFQSYLNCLQELRELTCTSAVLEGEGLKTLGQLPFLERLIVYSGRMSPAVRSAYEELSDDLFSSLRYLRWTSDGPDSSIDWTDGLRVMLRKVTTCELEINDCDSAATWTSGKFFPIIPCAPFLETFSVEYNPHCACSTYRLADLSRLIPFGQLSLQSVSFSKMRIPLKGPEASKILGSAWSKVTYLNLSSTIASLGDLLAFVHLPRLEHLVIHLVITVDGIPEGNVEPDFGLSLHTLEASPNSSAPSSIHWRQVRSISR